MLIFDRFPTLAAAEAFAERVAGDYDRLEAFVYEHEQEAFSADPFPFELTPPIVHVDRAGVEAELALEQLVELYGGCLAGS